MSIEKMSMINMVGHINELDKVAKLAVLMDCIQPVNAIQEIDTSDFTISTTENNMEALLDVCYIKIYSGDRDYSSLEKKMKTLKDVILSSNKTTETEDLILNFSEVSENINKLYEEFSVIDNEFKSKVKEKEETQKIIEDMNFLKNINIPLEELTGLKNFDVSTYKVPSENIRRIKDNYENIPSIVISIHKCETYETLLVFTPNELKNESRKIFDSVNGELVEVLQGFTGTPIQAIDELNTRLKQLMVDIGDVTKQRDEYINQNLKMINVLEKSLELDMKAELIKNNVAFTKEFFYLCGWIPESKIKYFHDTMKSIDDKFIIIEKNSHEVKNPSIVPPTKLRNNLIVQPFESLVEMYGVPSYNELDPTFFLGLSYMILFGAMFGDLGQGLVFFFAGLYLKYKKGLDKYGGVLARLGISSSFFGCMFGSIFGFEVIPALFERPMDNISDILTKAVIFGIGLLIIAYFMSLVNAYKKKDIEHGLFSKEGLAGLLFYISILAFAGTKVKGYYVMPTGVWISIFVVLLLVTVFKQPLANLVMGKRPLYNESKGDYFIEGGFGVIETLLSMFSNTVSFVRVGAFALNHVGLFIAFESLAHMAGKGVGSVLIYILGNVIIIGLEGLIVFIQGLRLEFYELFGKYYEGSGIPFKSVTLDESIKSETKNKWINTIKTNLLKQF